MFTKYPSAAGSSRQVSRASRQVSQSSRFPWACAILAVLGLGLVLASPRVEAQGAPPAQAVANLQWSNNLTGTRAGLPVTFTLAEITKIQIFVSSSSIPDNSTMAPMVELLATGAQVPATWKYVGEEGTKIYFRIRECLEKCSAFSPEVVKDLPVTYIIPGAPTNFQAILELLGATP